MTSRSRLSVGESNSFGESEIEILFNLFDLFKKNREKSSAKPRKPIKNNRYDSNYAVKMSGGRGRGGGEF